jgi:hypothetical protein
VVSTGDALTTIQTELERLMVPVYVQHADTSCL